MNTDKIKKAIVGISIILIMATTIFVFWQETPKEPAPNNESENLKDPEPNNESENLIVGQDGKFSTEILLPINASEGADRLVPKEFEGLINAPAGVNFVYEMKFSFNIYWENSENLRLMLRNQELTGSLLFSSNEDSGLLILDIAQESTRITANNESSVLIMVTVSMNMPNAEEEHMELIEKPISIAFTAKIIPDNNSSFGQRQINFYFPGMNSAENVRLLQKRTYRHSNLQPTGLFANVGDVLVVTSSKADNIRLEIGTNTRDSIISHELQTGETIINVTKKGAIYIINTNLAGVAEIIIEGATGQMPYFELGKTSEADFWKQMDDYTSASDAQFVSDKAIVTVGYNSAKTYLKNLQQLMENFDKFLHTFDKITGLDDNSSNPVNHTTAHRQHFIEAKTGYMYATHNYMGFNGGAALERLLGMGTSWGVWHEAGHQRQQAPWKWSGVSEATVNIYSAAAEEILLNRPTTFAKFGLLRNYMKNSNVGKNNFNSQSNELKFLMFYQLGQIFGEKFYPIIHQYYRENNVSSSNDAAKIQSFIEVVSKITNYNMTDYFENWGLSVEANTLEKIKWLRPLESKAWLSDDVNPIILQMSPILGVSLKDNNFISVTLSKNYDPFLLKDEKIRLFINNKYVSKLSSETAYDSYYDSVNKIWTTDTKLVDVREDVIIKIEVENKRGTFLLYEVSLFATDLLQEIENLISSQSMWDTLLDANQLATLRLQANDLKFNEFILSRLDYLEQKYLETLIEGVELNNFVPIILFSNLKFKQYEEIIFKKNGLEVAKLNYGNPENATLLFNILLSMSNKSSDWSDLDIFTIEIKLPHKVYTIFEESKEHIEFVSRLNYLGSLDSFQLHENTTQDELDSMYATINKVLNLADKNIYLEKYNAIQREFFVYMFGKFSINSNQKLVVNFTNQLFKSYKVVILKGGSYMSEINKGTPAYGSLNGLVFTTSAANKDSKIAIEFRHSTGNYRFDVTIT